MAAYDSFHANEYLLERFGDPKLLDRWQFPLNKLHELFKTLPPNKGIRVLDFGSGPVLQHGISAASYASEIVFSDISAPYRESIKKWLDKAPDAFNWSPKFDYVVKTLESRGDKAAREREERLRKIGRVAFCDIFSEQTMESGFEGPYDVVLECGCLEAACSDEESYRKGMRVLAALLRPEGLFVHYGRNSVSFMEDRVCSDGGKEYSCIHLSHEYIVSVLKEDGFRDIVTYFSPLDPRNSSKHIKKVVTTANGYNFIHARKM